MLNDSWKEITLAGAGGVASHHFGYNYLIINNFLFMPPFHKNMSAISAVQMRR
jgi:hypothetical protein